MRGIESQKVFIRRSCLTGEAVWIYRGNSRGAARKSYFLACQRELERVQRWNERASKRRANIMRLLNECQADMPVTKTLAGSQRQAAEQLKNISCAAFLCDKTFYNHIVEERRRRAEDREIRKRMRKHYNRDYV